MNSEAVTSAALRELVSEAQAVAAAIVEASDLVRLGARAACPVPWGACPEHGNTLTYRAGRSWCRHAGCTRSWGYDRAGLPCSDPVAVDVRDANGDGGPMCAGHATGAAEEIDGAVLTPLGTSGGKAVSR